MNATTPTASVSITIKPQDKRCRYWAKIIRAGEYLPSPSNVGGASDVPGAYLRNGEEELFPGDFLLEGEEQHHRKARGWVYNMGYVNAQGEIEYVQATAARKAAAKANGLPSGLLAGSGEVAGLIRLAHAIRMGISIA